MNAQAANTFKPDTSDRDQLREAWRLAAMEWVHLDDNASRLEEGRSIFLNELINTLVEQGAKISTAERMARTSDAFKHYVRKMHEARRAANMQRIAKEDADRQYYELVSRQAHDRAEMRMIR